MVDDQDDALGLAREQREVQRRCKVVHHARRAEKACADDVCNVVAAKACAAGPGSHRVSMARKAIERPKPWTIGDCVGATEVPVSGNSASKAKLPVDASAAVQTPR